MTHLKDKLNTVLERLDRMTSDGLDWSYGFLLVEQNGILR